MSVNLGEEISTAVLQDKQEAVDKRDYDKSSSIE